MYGLIYKKALGLKLLSQFFMALVFLTRLPLPGWLFRKLADSHLTENNHTDNKLASALWAFPLVGLLVGALMAGFAYVLHFLGVPFGLICIAVLGFGLLLTGALHEDGLADFCDGLGVHEKSRVLEVMRDSKIGSFGVIALILSLLWRVAAFHEFENVFMLSVGLIGVHVGARGLIVPLLLLPHASQSGLAFGAGRPGYWPVLVALLFTIVSFLILFEVKTVFLALLVAGLIVGGVALLAMKRLDGLTGDVYGAAEQVAEMSLLLVLVIML